MKSKKTLSNKKAALYIFVYTLVFLSIALSGVFSVYAFSSPSTVNLGNAGNFVILAKSGVSTTGTTAIVGDVGVSPAAATFITGFGLIADSSNQFSTSSLVTGKLYAADYTPPTPSTMTTAVSDMETAYIDAAGRTNPDATELGAGDISGMTLYSGLYKWSTGVLINTGVTLDCQNNTNAVFIFQIAQDLTVGNGAIITLSGGCQAQNIFWQVAGQTTLGTTSNFKGNILDQTAIALNTGASLNGRALAQTAVTLDANAVTIPSWQPIIEIDKTSGSENNGSRSSGGTSIENGSTNSISRGSYSNSDSNLKCASWSTCNSAGIQTTTCSYPNSNTTLTRTQSCTPIQKNVTIQDTTTPSEPIATDSGNNGQNNVAANQDNTANQNNNNNGITPVDVTSVTVQNGHENSWWNNFRTWFSGIFGGK